jgi:hypothetical protein
MNLPVMVNCKDEKLQKQPVPNVKTKMRKKKRSQVTQ